MLDTLGLSSQEKAARLDSIGGSDATVLFSGDENKIMRLWLEKTRQEEPEDLSDVLPVMMGHVTEDFNLAWFEKNTGRRVTNRHEVRRHDFFDYMACSLDGLTDDGATVIDAKHVNAFAKIDEVVAKYQPQLHHNMLVCGLYHAVLSVFIGTTTWEFVEVEFDHAYADALMQREEEFWQAVVDRTPPPFLAPVEAPVAVEKWRTMNLDALAEAGEPLPNWAPDIKAHLTTWLATREAAKKNEKAAKDVKGLLPDDVGELRSGKALVKRAKNGALRISVKEE